MEDYRGKAWEKPLEKAVKKLEGHVQKKNHSGFTLDHMECYFQGKVANDSVREKIGTEDLGLMKRDFS